MRVKYFFFLSLALMSCSSLAQQDKPEFAKPVRVLVFSKTAGYRHASLSSGIKMLFEGMSSYTTFDEWYSFRMNPRSAVNVLATLDEQSISKYDNEDWKMGDHPIVWWSEKNGIRSFYTGFGHTHEAFQDEKIREHIKNAINWASRRTN